MRSNTAGQSLNGPAVGIRHQSTEGQLLCIESFNDGLPAHEIHMH